MSSVQKLQIGNMALIKACLSQYRLVRNQLGSDGNVQIAIIGDNPTQFFFKIKGIVNDDSTTKSEFDGGEYIGVIWQNSLQTPPSFKIYTPNGVIKCNTDAVCTSISKYHPQNYRPELKIYGFITNMMGVIKCWRYTKYGIGLLYDGNEEKQFLTICKYAAESKEYNRKHHYDILEAFMDENLNECISTQLQVVTLEETKIEQDKETMIKQIETVKTTIRKHIRPTRGKAKNGTQTDSAKEAVDDTQNKVVDTVK